MLFSTFSFILGFLPAVFLVYFYLNKKKRILAAKVWLILSSLFFYSWWNVVYLPLIISSVLFNFYITNAMLKVEETSKMSKKSLLLVGLIFNVGLLFYFKYMDFFIENVNALTQSEIDLLHLALPLGISFYTLQQIAFIVDSYEGLVKKKNFLDYTLFVVFFPQLIAGPIVHYKEVMPQFESLKGKIFNHTNIALGLFVFSLGLFKKVIIADTFATWVHKGFDVEHTLSLFDAWISSLSYTFQLYFDFSGYSDMAIGIALLFNIKLPQNFNSPLKATGMIDYWKRWHITLTNFITSYIYTPIVRSFVPLTFHKAMFATVIVFLISGMWHGAGWTFIFWGLLHGTGVVINHYWQKKVKIKMPKYLAWFITFNFLNIGNVFFRATDFDRALSMLKSMFDTQHIMVSDYLIRRLHYWGFSTEKIDAYSTAHSYVDVDAIIMLIAGFIIALAFKNSTQLSVQFAAAKKVSFFWYVASVLLMTLSFTVMSFQTSTEFLYFNF
jgi:D-alanyl-lipoteichoic acid acyltransferase DltB (MBOAT superfamily)